METLKLHRRTVLKGLAAVFGATVVPISLASDEEGVSRKFNWEEIPNSPKTFPLNVHQHQVADVYGFDVIEPQLLRLQEEDLLCK